MRSSQPKIMNKVISTIDRLFMAVWGPSCCGKQNSISECYSKKLFLLSIFYFYQNEKPNFKSLEAKKIQFTKFSSFDLISELENCLLVFDNSCEEIFEIGYSWSSQKH